MSTCGLLFQWACWSSTKQTSSSSYQKVTWAHHDMAEKILTAVKYEVCWGKCPPSIWGSRGLITIILLVSLSLVDYYTSVILITVKPACVVTSIKQSCVFKDHLLVLQWKISYKLNLFLGDHLSLKKNTFSLSQKCPLSSLTKVVSSNPAQTRCTWCNIMW
jgi:hypothetical protein